MFLSNLDEFLAHSTAVIIIDLNIVFHKSLNNHIVNLILISASNDLNQIKFEIL